MGATMLSSELAGRQAALRRFMIGEQADMKVFCVREDGAEVFDGGR